MTDSLRTLKEDEIHLWWTFPERILDPDILARQLAVLSVAEQQKQQRFVFARHRHQYLVGHALVRDVLSHYFPVAPVMWKFNVNYYGKPFISWPLDCQGLNFNLSHTEGRAVVAVAWQTDIGVDVEFSTSRGNDMGIAKSFFSPIEVAQLERDPERFFDFWTLKEAYIKARGMGLSIPLDSFAFLLSENDHPRIHFHDGCPDRPERWDFNLYRGEGYRSAIAVSARGRRAIHRKIVPLESDVRRLACDWAEIPPS